jgi:hypothetical protein
VIEQNRQLFGQKNHQREVNDKQQDVVRHRSDTKRRVVLDAVVGIRILFDAVDEIPSVPRGLDREEDRIQSKAHQHQKSLLPSRERRPRRGGRQIRHDEAEDRQRDDDA